MAHTTSYAILRLTPDEARGETVNVGVVVFLPDRLDVRVQPSSQKIRALNPNAPVDALYALPDILNNLFGKGSDDVLRHHQLQHFPLVTVSPLGRFVADASSYEERVQSLLERFVKTPARTRQPERINRLEQEMRTAFSASKILGVGIDDIDRHRVVPNFPISAAEELYADFALRNGAWHITAVVDFRVGRSSLRGPKKGQAAIKAVTLDNAVRRFGTDRCVPLTVYTANDVDRQIIEPQLAMLADYSERLFDFAIPEDRAAYMEHMSTAAHSMN